jgi:glycosyltransferase involved in cell wall biosynthesis
VSARHLSVLLPGDVADPDAVSGGNVYGLRICRELAAHGWRVHRGDLDGGWPEPDRAARNRLGAALAALPDGAVVLLDGLLACGVPEIIAAAAERLRMAVLVHLPLADETGLDPAAAAELAARELATLLAVPAVIVTGPAAGRALTTRGVPPDRIHLAPPGVDPAPLAAGTDGASGLLCVASLTPRKGQDRLVDALAELADQPWTLRCVGPLHRAPGYVAALRDRIRGHGLDGRIQLTGPLTGDPLADAYAHADLAVLVSWTETYGMVVTEALARGVPVLAGAAGALPDTIGHAPDGSRPGLLVTPGQHRELVAALRGWFDDEELRYRLRTSARKRRAILPGWEDTARCVHEVLDRLHRQPVEEAR